MRLELDDIAVGVVRRALGRAGIRETGGQLFGRMHMPGHFAVTEMTVQRRTGSVGRFLVDVAESVRYAARFFSRTGYSYRSYNYIGEWHSHPLYPTQPSATDMAAMRSLVSSASFQGNFAVLLIVRLDGDVLTAEACVFDRTGAVSAVHLEFPA